MDPELDKLVNECPLPGYIRIIDWPDLYHRVILQDASIIWHRFGFSLKWLNTVFYKTENSKFRSVFLDCYYLMNNKEYHTDVKSVRFFPQKLHICRCYGNGEVSRWRIFWL